jgi:hypothetical protein
LDNRVRATQQYANDCWAHAFGVTLQLALLGPNGAPVQPNRNRSAQVSLADGTQGDFAKALDTYGPRVLQEESQRQRWYGARGFVLPASAANAFGGGRGTIVGGGGNPFLADQLKNALTKAQGVTDQLSRMTGGQGSPYISAVIGLADRMGWNRYVAMREVPGQDAVGVKPLLRSIIDGMKRGVRFSGYFNHVHSMAILGADLDSNSVYVTDSDRHGAILKVPLNPGQGHIDGMVAVVRKDLSDGMGWLNQRSQI